MDSLNENIESSSDSSFTSKSTLRRSNHCNPKSNEREQDQEEDKSSDVNKSLVTNMKPCSVDTSNGEEAGKKVPPPPHALSCGKFSKLFPPSPPPLPPLRQSMQAGSKNP